MDAREAARVLAAKRQRKALTCPVCGKSFEGLGRRTYCSRACRAKAYTQRKRTAGTPA